MKESKGRRRRATKGAERNGDRMQRKEREEGASDEGRRGEGCCHRAIEERKRWELRGREGGTEVRRNQGQIR